MADIRLPVAARAHVVERADVEGWLPVRTVDAHKWKAAVWVVAGSPGMLGAAHLSTRAAGRVGAGMVRLTSPGVASDPLQPTEVVGRAATASGFAGVVLDELARFGALVVGPGLGREDSTVTGVRELVAKSRRPTLVDGDGLSAFAGRLDLLHGRAAPTVLTPHDGEFATLTGHPPGPDRLGAARALAAEARAVVLLKGPTTVVAEPGGRALVVTEGDARLATAGTGDVLSGAIGGLLAQGVDAFEAAAAGAWLHGAAARRGWPRGLVAGDLPDLLAEVLSS